MIPHVIADVSSSPILPHLLAEEAGSSLLTSNSFGQPLQQRPKV
jgi:hypothetical protein